jgi:hypothetical protein
MSLETKKQLREVLVATGTSSSLSPSLSPYLCCCFGLETCKQQQGKENHWPQQKPESQTLVKKRFVDYLVEHSLFYAGSKLMLGFEERVWRTGRRRGRRRRRRRRRCVVDSVADADELDWICRQ